MTIYPNSVKGIYTLESNKFDLQLKKIIIFDMYGNYIHIIDQPSEKQEIDLRSHPDGIYHISAVFDKNEAPVRLKVCKS